VFENSVTVIFNCYDVESRTLDCGKIDTSECNYVEKFIGI
jgi:hypothetical protein